MNIEAVGLDDPATLQHTPPGGRLRRILLADRNPEVCQSCLNTLAQGDYQVEVCEDGESAWRMLLKEPFDLLVASEDMPRLSGLALIRQLRLAPIDIQIILITQDGIAESVSQDPWHKIAAVLPRDFTAEQLLTATRDVLDAKPSLACGPPVEAQPDV